MIRSVADWYLPRAPAPSFALRKAEDFDRVERGGGENATHVGCRLAPADRWRLPVNGKPCHAQARERKASGKAGALHTGQGRDFLESLAAEGSNLRVVRVARGRHTEL